MAGRIAGQIQLILKINSRTQTLWVKPVFATRPARPPSVSPDLPAYLRARVCSSSSSAPLYRIEYAEGLSECQLYILRGARETFSRLYGTFAGSERVA